MIIPRVLRRRKSVKESSRRSSFLGEYADIKQRMRDATADHFSAHIKVPNPRIFCMPHYDSLCAKTINDRLPQALFYGVDRYKIVAENTQEVVPGKKITMFAMMLQKYITTDPDKVRFDGAWLDYYGASEIWRQDEIALFVEHKMQVNGILAVTLQTDPAGMSRVLERLLRTKPETSMIFCEPYQTGSSMCHAIFVLQNPQNVV